jgi:hypothetical protein
MLSLRMSESLVPVLLTSYTAMLPVIAGLLAIASAATVAAVGIAGVLGLGIAAISQRGANKNVWGAWNIRDERGALEQLLQPLKDALKSPEIKRTIDIVTAFTDDFFGETLPDSFKNFVSAVDIGSLSSLFERFQQWLPATATSIAELGNEIYNAIGARSLSSINKMFKYLAGGLKNTAYWLKAGGFEDIENFGSVLGRFISKLTDLGKSVLPILSDALDSIYPYPIEPVIDKMTEFFDGIKGTDVQRALNDLVKVGVTLVILGAISSMLLGVIVVLKGITKIIAFAIIGLIPALIQTLTAVIIRVVHVIYNVFDYVFNKIFGDGTKKFGDIFNPLKPRDQEGAVRYSGALGYIGNPSLAEAYIDGAGAMLSGLSDYDTVEASKKYIDLSIQAITMLDTEVLSDGITETALDGTYNSTSNIRATFGGAVWK